jgi:hypothetical protein
MKRTAAALIGALMSAIPALAQSGPPLSAKNLQYANPGEIVAIPAAAAPQGIKVGDQFNLVDADNRRIIGTGTVSGTFRDGGNTGPITAWSIKVDTLKR